MNKNYQEKRYMGKPNYDVYLDERKILIQTNKETSQQFDKYILTLSAGALAISITFLENIVPNPDENTLIYLILGWLVFILSMLATLISFIISQKACDKQIDLLESPKDDKNNWSIWTQRLNILSIICFVGGAIFLSIFSILNIYK